MSDLTPAVEVHVQMSDLTPAVEATKAEVVSECQT
jgi:hypothetical protein